MKKIVSILFVITAINLSASAQSVEMLISRIDSIKTAVGEYENAYLNALSDVVAEVYLSGNHEEAHKLRLYHLDLIKKKYGEKSLECAEDLWKLGNISSFRGDDYKLECYKRSKNIYENVDNGTSTYPYCDLLWQNFILYSKSNDYDNASESLTTHLRYCKNWVNKEYKGAVMVSGEDIVVRYSYLGNTYYSAKKNMQAITAFEESIRQAQIYNVVDERQVRNYVMLRSLYSELDNISKELDAQENIVEFTKKIYGQESDEYIKELTTLNLCLWEHSNLLAIKNNFLNILNILSQRCKKSGIEVFNDNKYRDTQSELVSYCVAFKDWQGVILEGNKLAELYRAAEKENSTEYWELLEDLICAYSQIGDLASEVSLFDEFEKLSSRLNKQVSEAYCNYLTYKIDALSQLSRFEECEKVINDKVALTHKLWGEFSWESLVNDLLISQTLINKREYSEASKHVNRCHKTLTSGKCKIEHQDSLIIASNLNHLSGKLSLADNPSRAEQLLRKSIEDFSQTGQPSTAPYVDLGILYISIHSNFKFALECFEKAKTIMEAYSITPSLDYITILNNIAVCYQHIGKPSEAIAILDLQEEIIIKHYGTSHPTYALLLMNKSSFYARITDYSNAIKYGEKGMNIISRIYGTNCEEFADCVSNLGYYYTEIGDTEKAKENISRAIEIFKGHNSRKVLNAYVNMLNIYYIEKNWKELDATVQSCSSLLKEWNLDYTEIAASFTGCLGYIYMMENNPEAKKYFKYAIESCEKAGRTNAEEYLTYELYYFLSHYINLSQNESMIPSLLSVFKNSYLSNAIYYNALEREKFMTSSRYSQVRDIIFSARTDGNYDSSLYDFLLFNKGLLLGTSIGFISAIYNSNDDSLIALYNELSGLRRYLSGENVSGISCGLEEAKSRADILERKITISLRDKGGYSDGLSLTWNEVKQALKEDEAAVEFVVYKDLIDGKRKYAALIIKNYVDKPIFVSLCDANELEDYPAQPNLIYSPDSNLSHEFYKKVWGPIIKELQGISNVYFSTAGVLSQLAIEQLYDNDKRVCESKNLIRLSSTREVCYRVAQKKYNRAVLYGGLNYDTDIDSMISESRKIKSEGCKPSERFNSTISDVTRGSWGYLPATLNEVNEISSIINKKIDKQLYTGSLGNEESFKALSGERFEVLHIATHGFYLDETKVARNEFYASHPLYSSVSESSSVLYRCGLLLSGGNLAWKGNKLPENIEDGVLTAAEIINMDLSHCDIVVISACETGLGKITDEGVYGLQRAFKNAGCNTIIMSLWEVDDQATSYMMQNFYKNIVKGKNKREAFSVAQAAVKKKYSDPRYWAAFIMLD